MSAKGFFGSVQKIVFELKILKKSIDLTIKAGHQQTAEYLQRTGMADTVGPLVIFDRREDQSWYDKVFEREATGPGDEKIYIWGM